LIHSICCLAGSATLIDDFHDHLSEHQVDAAIAVRDTATLFDWLLIVAVRTISCRGKVTNVGARFLEEAREALGQLETAVKVAGAAGRAAVGQLTIGSAVRM
jgi:hypothetical protein